jgi:hypothetical protein
MVCSKANIRPTLETNQLIMSRKALPGFFLCIFSSLTCLKKTVFSKAGSSAVKKVLAQAILGSSNQRKVPTSLFLFLKSEKIPALLSIEKGLVLEDFLNIVFLHGEIFEFP